MAKWISSDILHLSTMELYTGKDMNFSTKEWKEVEDILARLKQREPLQYILQEAPFAACLSTWKRRAHSPSRDRGAGGMDSV